MVRGAESSRNAADVGGMARTRCEVEELFPVQSSFLKLERNDVVETNGREDAERREGVHAKLVPEERGSHENEEWQ